MAINDIVQYTGGFLPDILLFFKPLFLYDGSIALLVKRNLVGKILGKIKIFVQDFVPIRTALLSYFNFISVILTMYYS